MEPSNIPDPTRQTPFAQVFKLFVILGTVMIAEHRSYPVGIANEYGGENQADIHQQAINDNTVFPRILKQLYVVDNRYHGPSGFGHEFRGTIGHAFDKCPAVPNRLYQLQETVILSHEINEREHTAHDLAQGRGCCRACKSPVETDDEKRIEGNVTQSCEHCDNKPQPRFFSSDKEKLERIRQYPCRQSQNKDPSVQHAVFKKTSFCAKPGRNLGHKDKSRRHHQKAQAGRYQYNQ